MLIIVFFVLFMCTQRRWQWAPICHRFFLFFFYAPREDDDELVLIIVSFLFVYVHPKKITFFLFCFLTTNFKLKLWPLCWFRVPSKFGIKSQWWHQRLQCPCIWKQGSKETFIFERLSKCFFTMQFPRFLLSNHKRTHTYLKKKFKRSSYWSCETMPPLINLVITTLSKVRLSFGSFCSFFMVGYYSLWFWLLPSNKGLTSKPNLTRKFIPWLMYSE